MLIKYFAKKKNKRNIKSDVKEGKSSINVIVVGNVGNNGIKCNNVKSECDGRFYRKEE